MKTFTINVYSPEEAFSKTVEWLKNDDTIKYDVHFQNIIKKCDSINEYSDSYYDDIIEIIEELYNDGEGYFKPIYDEMRDEFHLDCSVWYIETNWF